MIKYGDILRMGKVMHTRVALRVAIKVPVILVITNSGISSSYSSFPCCARGRFGARNDGPQLQNEAKIGHCSGEFSRQHCWCEDI